MVNERTGKTLGGFRTAYGMVDGMARRSDPFALWSLGMQMGWMTLEAQAVIAMRLWGMAGLWSVSPSENSRMVSEKAAAFTRSGQAVTKALISGQSADSALAVGLRPLRKATRANSRRLGRRGPKMR